ncbi:MAG: DUF2437 domain-containing protein [Candidatus Omnitrophica bacterium]|nr:DUF2437 domain-containing protein [Candidatus Omnitrophota bacterium]
MKIIRFSYAGGVYRGVLTGDRVDFEQAGGNRTRCSLEDVELLPPVSPGKIICFGLSYAPHAEELGMDPSGEPVIFLKPPSALTGHGGKIVIPDISRRVDHEAELAVVIGQQTSRVSRTDAFSKVMGYTCFNDVTARDIQEMDGQWTRAKSFDSFAPLGPWIETELDVSDISVEAYLNGELRQKGRTSELIFGVDRMIEFVSRVMTLYPGDVIATGTPPGVGPILPGDVVEIRIEGIGSLVNEAVAET